MTKVICSSIASMAKGAAREGAVCPGPQDTYYTWVPSASGPQAPLGSSESVWLSLNTILPLWSIVLYCISSHALTTKSAGMLI